MILMVKFELFFEIRFDMKEMYLMSPFPDEEFAKFAESY